MIARAAAVLAALAGGCDRRAPIASCSDDLRAVYVSNSGSRWMILDNLLGIEVFPLSQDIPKLGGLEVGPRAMDLDRTPSGPVGHVRRRYMRGRDVCIAKVPVHITACEGDTIELVLSDPEPPLTWEPPCTWPRLESSRRERWTRE